MGPESSGSGTGKAAGGNGVCSPGGGADGIAKAISGINGGYLDASIQQSWSEAFQVAHH